MAEFLTDNIVFGLGGLDVRQELELIPPTRLSRMLNVRRDFEGALVPRLGMTSLATIALGAPSGHSAIRLADPRTGNWTRIWGCGTALYYGQSGALTQLDTGYSGLPLSFTPMRAQLGSASWLVVGDTARMSKVQEALRLPLGLPPPGTPLYSVKRAAEKTDIDLFEAAGWSNNATASAAASNATSSDCKQGAASVEFTAGVGAAAGAFTCFWAKANVKDLNVVGTRKADDADHFHLWLKADKPQYVQEIRIYFVLGALNTSTIPGTSTTVNTDAYVRAFRPSDLSAFVQTDAFSVDTVEEIVTQQLLDQTVVELTGDRLATTASQAIHQEQEGTRAGSSPELAPGQGQWNEYGIVGIPLRRGTFLRIGNNVDLDWSDVVGLVVLVRTNAAQTVKLYLDALYLAGGYEPDTSEPGFQPYDYRYTHYDLRTGAQSNGSPIQDESVFIDVVRQPVRLFPAGYGDVNMRQRFYRRGGTLPDDWYLVGQNDRDGGCALDVYSDAELSARPQIPKTNHQPVDTVDSNGARVVAQPIPAVFGPLNGRLFGCGDPKRPGHLYWSNTNEIDHWGVNNNLEVCPPSEELMNGCTWAGQGWVFSRQKLYSVLSAGEIVVAQPTACSRGLVARWAFTVGRDGIYFVAPDGIYRTNGGPEQSLSDARLLPLFRGEQANGLADGILPVNFDAASALQLTIHEDELYFGYEDTAGVRQVLVYSLNFDYWRQYRFGVPQALLTSEATAGASELIIGAAGSPAFYLHSGLTDVADDVSCAIRTGALNQQVPRALKLYGDLVLHADRNGGSIITTVYINDQTGEMASVITSTGSGKQQYVLDPFGATPLMARNVSLDIAWTSSRIFHGGASYIVQPETTVGRVTDWDFQGTLADKWVKGVELECDTFGSAKSVLVQIDGTTVETLSVTASGRRVLQFSWAQLKGRLLRLRATDAVPWLLYRIRWIFDEEPLALLRWETQELMHGNPGFKLLQRVRVTLRSSATVTLQITAYQQGTSTVVKSYTIASTGGVKAAVWVSGLEAQKGVLFKYLITCAAAVYVYREETAVELQPLDGSEIIVVRPFGNDDLDLVRSVVNAETAVRRPGSELMQR